MTSTFNSIYDKLFVYAISTTAWKPKKEKANIQKVILIPIVIIVLSVNLLGIVFANDYDTNLNSDNDRTWLTSLPKGENGAAVGLFCLTHDGSL